MKNILETIKIRLDEVDDQICNLEDKPEENTPSETRKKKVRIV